MAYFWVMGKKYVISKCPLYKGYILIQVLKEINIFELNVISRIRLCFWASRQIVDLDTAMKKKFLFSFSFT